MKFAKTDIADMEQRQRLIDVFVNSIYVYSDKVLITFNYKDGERILPFDKADTAVSGGGVGKKRDKGKGVQSLLHLALATLRNIWEW
jgi:hypothetical protein